MTPSPLLTARGLEVRRPTERGDVQVLDGVDVTLAAGELVDVTGPSGSGKTTLLLALARLMPGARGELALEGRRAADWAPDAWRAKVTYVPQRHAIFDGTVRDNLVLPWSLKVRSHEQTPDDAELVRSLSGVGLDVGLDREAAKLSVGQAARVALLRVVLTHPDCLLLDEPDAALDNASAGHVRQMIADFTARGGAAVRVRHGADDGLAACRLLLEDGRLEEVAAGA